MQVTLTRLPWVLGAVVSGALLLALAVLALFSTAELGAQNHQRQQTMARLLAEQVATPVAVQQVTLAQLAGLETVIGAFKEGDYQQRSQLASRLESHLPYYWKLRLLPAGFQETRPHERPPIGYADIDLINAAESTGQAPPVVADEGGTPQARIAMVQPVFERQNGELVGHLLLVARFDFVAELVSGLELEGGYLQLQQPRKTGEPQVLAAAGNNALANSGGFIATIPGSQWQVAYWPATESSSGKLWVVFGAVAIVLILIASGTHLLLGRGLNRSITADLAILVTMARDARAGALKPHYPSQAKDIVGTVHTLREELAGLRAAKSAAKPRAKPAPTPGDDTPDIDLELE